MARSCKRVEPKRMRRRGPPQPQTSKRTHSARESWSGSVPFNMSLSEISVISQKRLLRTDYQIVPIVFAVALFVSALLLFSVQPLIAKMLLPYLGGTPAVWNTCMVFFQVMLLCGYVYSHILPRAIGIARHAILHLGLMIATAFFLPIAVSPTAIESLHSASSAPLWLLATLLTTVGLPFFTLSTSAPLLQSW